MSRAALLFVGATVAASCGGTTESRPSDGGREATTDAADDYNAPVTLYGPGPIYDAGPPLHPEAGTDAQGDAPSEATTDGPGYDAPAVLYGPAMIDGG